MRRGSWKERERTNPVKGKSVIGELLSQEGSEHTAQEGGSSEMEGDLGTWEGKKAKHRNPELRKTMRQRRAKFASSLKELPRPQPA